MNEVEFVFFKGVIIKNPNTMEYCKCFWKNSNLLYSYLSCHIEDDIMHNHEQKQELQKKTKT
jgi:hypothetical protein